MRALLTTALAVAALSLVGCVQWGTPGNPDGCLKCHDGIEEVHAPFIQPERCSVCHGGDATKIRKDKAHVPIPEEWADIRGPGLPPSPDGFIKDFAPDQLDAIDPAYLRFINPGDVRVLDETCGICHADHAETMPKSVMATNAGHYWPSLYLAGVQDERIARFGSFAATDEDCAPDDHPGSVCEVEVLRPPDAMAAAELFGGGLPDFDDLLEFAWRHYLSKNCNTCHQGGYPRNNSPGLYRSSGCTSCHMVYDELGTYRGGDPTLPRGTPVHAAEHVITTAIPTEQCATCHFQGGRIGLLYRGIREGGFGSDNQPPNAGTLNRTLYGHAPGYYIEDEDTTNDVDETPPDLHAEAGMVCADCHVGSDVHGGGRLWSTSKQQVTIACEDCHGTVRQRAEPTDGVFVTARRANPLEQLSVRGDGTVVLTRRMDGEELVVPQPADLLAAGDGSDRMHASMGEDADGWSHTDSLTCDTCHTPQNFYCIGCHVSVDMRLDQVDYQTGLPTPGLTRGSRTDYTLDHLLLGTGVNGRAQTVHPSQQVQMMVVGSSEFGSEDGEMLMGGVTDEGREVGEFRQAHGFEANIGFMPFFQHTTRREARYCEDCHRSDSSDGELQRVRGVYGFGTGEFILDGPDGQQVDGLQFLDADGNDLTAWVHEGTGPLEEAVRSRAIGVVLDEVR